MLIWVVKHQRADTAEEKVVVAVEAAIGAHQNRNLMTCVLGVMGKDTGGDNVPVSLLYLVLVTLSAPSSVHNSSSPNNKLNIISSQCINSRCHSISVSKCPKHHELLRCRRDPLYHMPMLMGEPRQLQTYR